MAYKGAARVTLVKNKEKRSKIFNQYQEYEPTKKTDSKTNLDKVLINDQEQRGLSLKKTVVVKK